MQPAYTSDLARDPLPLRGRSVVVTGVSRRGGIGYALACRLAAYGASILCHHFSPHDDEQPWGSDDLALVLDGVRRHLVGDARVVDLHADLAEADTPERVIEAAAGEFGRLDALVCNQALSGSDGALGELTAVELDRHWAVDARASILLAQAFAARHEDGTPASIVFLTSGQGLGPMPGEVAYAAAKAALAGVTTTIADQLADRGIRVNTVNPGPVDTGYLTEDMMRMVKPMFPFGRFGEPDDPARLIAWLLTDEARWIVGQTINTEGGFGRWRPRGGGGPGAS
ncbi:3-ketoacyl-ACP reductase [Aeromicrobium sp. PE09-221]|uniref:SDR family oxidoreductase n=1 Tax=Aeromicrobium sp. PE09-221 TaxID=1898043 RepID=UPI000B3E9BD3|nr:SDR family oxidoreductase [Aeromicrobium sp. PE09-221]OUZ08862.1 3-ketoacyl-ACP reductase [Aeromicrobium sp. PE09-221]